MSARGSLLGQEMVSAFSTVTVVARVRYGCHREGRVMPMLARTPRNIVVAAEAEVPDLAAVQRQAWPRSRLIACVAENLDGGPASRT